MISFFAAFVINPVIIRTKFVKQTRGTGGYGKSQPFAIIFRRIGKLVFRVGTVEKLSFNRVDNKVNGGGFVGRQTFPVCRGYGFKILALIHICEAGER